MERSDLERFAILIFVSACSFTLGFYFAGRGSIEFPHLIISPMDGNEIVDLINNAEESIYAEVYIFTSDEIADAIVSARARGVDVKIIIDGNVEGEKIEEIITKLKSAGVELREHTLKTLHSKFAIFDGKRVLIGSHNWSKSAITRNREVSIVLESRWLADKLMDIFEEDWEESVEITDIYQLVYTNT